MGSPAASIANAGTRVASRPASLVWVALARIVARMLPSSESSASRNPAYGPGAGTSCQRAAANTRFGCRLSSGSVSSQWRTSGSPATPSAHSRKQGESQSCAKCSYSSLAGPRVSIDGVSRQRWRGR